MSHFKIDHDSTTYTEKKINIHNIYIYINQVRVVDDFLIKHNHKIYLNIKIKTKNTI
jgi:hypothetical protein